MNSETMRDRRLGVLFGSAFGDALGRPTEFMHTTELIKLGGPFRDTVGIHTPRQGVVTDDTQMALAVAHSALDRYEATPEDLTEQIVKNFVLWLNDPASMDGQRAPGMTCVGAVTDLKKINHPRHWYICSRPQSKGNGANMRVAPLALRTDWSWETLAGAAQMQAAVTHGHPTALAAAHLTAVAVRMLLTGYSSPGPELINDLLHYAASVDRHRYFGDWLGHVWQGWAKHRLNPLEYIKLGWAEMIDALLRIYQKPARPEVDPCVVAGQGWVAEEALTVSLHILSAFPDDPVSALRRAAYTNGDSDSIGAITGALVGATHGLSAFPRSWVRNIEYRTELTSLGNLMHKAAER